MESEYEIESSESRKNARLAIFELAHIISVPMSLKAVIKLNVANAIWQCGANTPLSASEILSSIGKNGADPENLQRVLRLLTSHGIFKEHIVTNNCVANVERRYSLTEVGKTLVADSDGLSQGLFVLQHFQDELVRAWALVDEVVLDPTAQPFVNLFGEAPYDYYGKKPEMNELMQKAMSGTSIPVMKAFLSSYDGFQGVKTLVDVGGSRGTCLQMIMQKYPTIRQGINFDLPEVVAIAPDMPGITHVGGDIMKSIPSADAIFMKWMLTTWTGDECKKIMENCYKALEVGGKLIACDPVLPHETDDSLRTRALLEGDIFLMTVYKTKHKSEAEFKKLGQAAGFSHFQAFYFDHFYTILEFIK